MDIYSFFNSRDVADYLRGEKHEFTAAEAAYIVYLSDTATLDEKLVAWQEIVDTMPDCPVCHSALDPYFKRDYKSEHQFLREYIFTMKLMLRKFMDGEGCVYMPHEYRFTPETAIRYGRDEHSLWIQEMPDPFSSFDKCVDSLRHDDEGAPEFDRYCIAKRAIDGGDSGYVTLDERFRVLDVTWANHGPSDYDDVDMHLCCAFLELPIPFKRGDIVIDRTARDPRPFVFDYLKFWDSATLAEHGHVLSAERAEKIDRYVANWRAEGSKDDSYMPAMGWSLAPGSLLAAEDPALLAYDPFGACHNYLDLEYYREPLEGKLRLLEVASRWARGEMDLDFAIGNAALVDAEVRAARLRSEMETEYIGVV